jgi:hypothetical protein
LNHQLQRTVTAVGDLFDRVGVLDGVAPPRKGHQTNPIEIEDSDDGVKEEEVEVKVGEDKGKEREVSRSPPTDQRPRMTGRGPRGRPQALDWLADIPDLQRPSEAGPSRNQRARRGRPYSR